MTRTLWRIAVEAPTYTASDMSGKGAKLTGGRWNSVGTPIVYCSSNIALAAIETVLHLRSGGLPSVAATTLKRWIVDPRLF